MSFGASSHSAVNKIRSETAATDPSHYRYVDRIEALACIEQPEVNLVIWQRPLPEILKEFIQRLIKAKFYFRQCVKVNEFERALLAAFSATGECDTDSILMLEDLVLLVSTFAQLNGVSEVKVLIETLADDECRLFHVDRNSLRLLCTYAGPGTQWLANDEVNRHALGSGSNHDIIGNAGIRASRPGEVLLLKGERYPGNYANGIVHRSPPVVDRQLQRLRLRLDLPFFGGGNP